MSPEDLIAVLPEAILTVVATAVMLLAAFRTKGKEEWCGFVTLLGLLAAMAALTLQWPPQGPAFDGMVLADPFSIFFHLLFLGIAILIVLGSASYLRREQLAAGEYYALLEPFFNLDLERELGKLGAEVHRTLMMGDWVQGMLILEALGFPRRDPFDKDSHPASGADDFLDPVGEGPAHERGLLHLGHLDGLLDAHVRDMLGLRVSARLLDADFLLEKGAGRRSADADGELLGLGVHQNLDRDLHAREGAGLLVDFPDDAADIDAQRAEGRAERGGSGRLASFDQRFDALLGHSRGRAGPHLKALRAPGDD